jgi:hypothetical protein
VVGLGFGAGEGLEAAQQACGVDAAGAGGVEHVERLSERRLCACVCARVWVCDTCVCVCVCVLPSLSLSSMLKDSRRDA